VNALSRLGLSHRFCLTTHAHGQGGCVDRYIAPTHHGARGNVIRESHVVRKAKRKSALGEATRRDGLRYY